MKNYLYKKGWNSGANPSRMEPTLITLIKETYNCKSDEDFVKIKLRRVPKSSTSKLYEFKMPLFDHGNPEEF